MQKIFIMKIFGGPPLDLKNFSAKDVWIPKHVNFPPPPEACSKQMNI